MTGIHIILKDGVRARVDKVLILDTYAGQLAGTLTTGTKYRLSEIKQRMDDLKSGKAKGYYYLEPELVDEAQLCGFSEQEARSLRRRTDLGKCLKEQYIVVTLHIYDDDYCNIIDLHWFQTGRELYLNPLVALISDAATKVSFEELYPYCEHVDWFDMY